MRFISYPLHQNVSLTVRNIIQHKKRVEAYTNFCSHIKTAFRSTLGFDVLVALCHRVKSQRSDFELDEPCGEIQYIGLDSSILRLVDSVRTLAILFQHIQMALDKKAVDRLLRTAQLVFKSNVEKWLKFICHLWF